LFELLCLRQFGFQFRGEQSVFRDADRALGIAEGVLDDRLIFAPAEYDADGRSVLRGRDETINRGLVEVHFADEFRFEVAHLKINHDVAVQPGMVEEQIEEEFLAVYLQPVLIADERKT
jgi:hypothetical protein